jgi:hypothetical protein
MTTSRLTGALALFAAAPLMAAAQAPRVPGLPEWTVAAQPAVRIGDGASDATTFSRVAAVRVSSGEIVVADGASAELRVFTASGTFVRNLSRKGRGPGEFQDRSVFAKHGDSLFIADMPLSGRNAHSWTVGGGFVSSFRLQAMNATKGMAPLGRLDNGRYLVAEGRGFIEIPVGLKVDQLLPDSNTLGIYAPGDSGRVTWIGRFLRATMVTYPSPLREGLAIMGDAPLAPHLVSGVSGNQVWLGETDDGRISIYSSEGNVVTTATLPVPARPFDQAALDAAARVAVDAAGDRSKARVQAGYSQVARPKTAPRFTSFVPGVDGEMWVGLFAENPAAPVRYVMFDRSGKPTAQAVVPGGVTPFEFGRDYVLGSVTDADGVESVVMYALRRAR